MRTALSISSLLFVVILAYGLRIGVFAFGSAEQAPIAADVNVGRSVRINSCGATLPPVRFGLKPQRSTIYVDGRMLRSYFDETGLRLVTIPPGDGLPKLYTFNLPRDTEAPARLLELIQSIPADTAVALASFRTIQPKGPAREAMRSLVVQALKQIGAQTDPTDDNLVSWAILSLRRPSGWVPLSEVYSKTKGMSISYNLEDDRSRYDGFKPVLRVDHTKRQMLSEVTQQATKATAGFKVAGAFVGGVPIQSILLPLVPDAGILWRFVHLGQFPTFECQLGLPSDAYPYVPGALCSLVINGEVIATQGLGQNAKSPDEWIPWRVDLSAFSDRWVSVELRATPLAKTLPTSVFWGQPSILSSPTKVPSVTAFNRLLGRLDLNKDGIVGRPEVSEFMRAQDADQDGYVTIKEAFKPDIIEGVDRDADGRASYDELDQWFDLLLDPPD